MRVFYQKEVMQEAFSDLLLCCTCPRSGSGVSSGIPTNQGFLTTPTTLSDDNEDSLLNSPTISAITGQPLESGLNVINPSTPRAWHTVDYSIERGPPVAPDSLYIIESLWGKVCSGAMPCLAVLWADYTGQWAAKAPGKMPAVL